MNDTSPTAQDIASDDHRPSSPVSTKMECGGGRQNQVSPGGGDTDPKAETRESKRPSDKASLDDCSRPSEPEPIQPTLTKRKRTVLSIAEKADLIRRMRNGESQRQLAFEYGIGTSTVSDVKKHEAEILRYVETNGDFVAMNRRKLEAGAKVDVEEAVFDWLMKEMRAGRELSPSDVMSKARAEHHRLRGNEEFRASTGWLERFKRRYNIHSFRPGEEDLWKPTLGRSSNSDSAFGASHARRKDAVTAMSKRLHKMSGKRSFKNRSRERSPSPTTIKAETDSHEEYDYADMRTDTISPDLSHPYHPQVSLEEGHLNLDLPPVEEIPSAGEAASMLSKALVWAAAQPETAPQELFVLKQLQTKAALKCLLKATQ
ncbi:uncharacterized protein LOC135204082 [Macrobrachium nipponense]|uniref:uncharacterized protein LOC135204082 n=1 Tax=Macrobrachium nipponense TaxID=159736 RepID=UPI0030C7F08C